MAHRLAFPTNTVVPIAVKVDVPGGGALEAFDPSDQTWNHDSPYWAAPESILGSEADGSTDAQVRLLALDQTPLDMPATRDTLWLEASFIDKLGRLVQVSAREVAPGNPAEQHFGGVATNRVRSIPSLGREGSLWFHQPLAAWARCDVFVDGELTDSGVLGVISLVEELSYGQVHAHHAPTLSLQVCPRRVQSDGGALSHPLRAAEELGMPGWTLVWSEPSYAQAPVMSVRVERGDTMERMAKELSVDVEALNMANPDCNSAPFQAGDLVRVPMLVRAASAAPKKVHPSVALTWNEIVKGWTTLN